ncbi:MAG TPA: discoidin domain-containing protein [Bacteroidales bacterium]|nr:discoidin domain-containing protein [Bacteroidales bacterium]
MMLKISKIAFGLSVVCLLGYLPALNAQSMLVESLSGQVTQNEINAFRTYVQQKITAPTYGGSNVWVFGNSGKQIEACGLMYEVSKDLDILNRMIYLSDAALAGRNDLASSAEGGQQVTWTGKIDPVWPSSAYGVLPAGAGVEQGEILSHIAFCAKLILETPSIWNDFVSIGDPKGFGATYKARAIKYIQECDYVIDNWILPNFIRTSEYNRYYFPGSPNTYMANSPAPWNQAWMLTNGFVRLTLCHVLLGDAPTRVAQYDAIVKPNIDWFFSRLVPNQSSKGTACWKWNYSLNSGLEDTNHAAYDVQGLYIALRSGRYGLTDNDLIPFANTYCDIVLNTVQNGNYAGKVDGSYGTTDHSDGDNYVRDEYLYLIDFRPDFYEVMGNIEISKNKIASSPQITARLLWQKSRRIPAPSDLTVSAIIDNRVNLTWKDNSANETAFRIERSVNQTTWEFLTTVSANATNYIDTNIDSQLNYFYRVKAENGSSYSDYTRVAGTSTLLISNISLNKSVSASNIYSTSYGGEKAVDGNTSTRWATSSVTNATLDVDLGGVYTFSQAITREYNSRVTGYKIQYWSDNTWNDAYTGTTIGALDKTDNFSPVTGSKVRLNILSATSEPSIYEFTVFGYETPTSSLSKPINPAKTNLWNTVNPNVIGFRLPNATFCNLAILDMNGNIVKVLANTFRGAGTNYIDLNTVHIPNGMFFVRLKTNQNNEVMKLIR